MTNNKYKILLVEDEANIQNLVTTMLESAHYQVILAKNCAMAETMYASHQPDLIILDLGLPDKDGMTLLSYVRKDSLTPIIVLSARSDERDKVRAQTTILQSPSALRSFLPASAPPCALPDRAPIPENFPGGNLSCRI